MKTSRSLGRAFTRRHCCPGSSLLFRRSSSTETSTTAAHFEVGAKYVALGSSYAAGPGIPTQSGGICTRSSHNYPNLVAAKLKLSLV